MFKPVIYYLKFEYVEFPVSTFFPFRSKFSMSVKGEGNSVDSSQTAV